MMGEHGATGAWVAITLAMLLGGADVAEAQAHRWHDPGPRVRVAVEAGLGGAIGDSSGGAFTLAGHLGVQTSHLFAVYWKPALHVDGWGADAAGLDSYAFTSQLAMADFTLWGLFQVGGGAGLDIGRFGVCEDGCEMRSGQVKPAIEGRIGVVLPLPSMEVRWGIPIMFNAHSSFLFGERIHSLTMTAGLIRY